MQNDQRIAEIETLAAEDGLPLAVQPATVCALEDAGWVVDPFTGQLWPEPTRPGIDLNALFRRLVLTALALLLMLASVLPLPAQAVGSRVRRCYLVRGQRICYIIAGGSGITPPVLRQ
jgi:hypothetical protein